MNTTISPKVFSSTIVTILLTGLVASLNAITPEMFAWAGDYKVLIFVALAAIGSAVGGYLKGDPLRTLNSDDLTLEDVYGPDTSEDDEDDLEEVEDEPEHKLE